MTGSISEAMWGEIKRVVASMPAGTSCVVTGSIVEGLGNPNSDIDLYAITEDRAPGRGPSIGLRLSYYVDCEHMKLASLEQLCERVRGTTWSTIDQLSLREIDRFYRLAISVPVRVSSAVAATIARFTKADACDVFARYAAARAYEHLAAGAWANAVGDDGPAQLLLREAALWHASGCLAVLGEGYPSLKWAGEKAARHFGRGSEAFRDLVGGYLHPTVTVAQRLARLRSAINKDPALVAALDARTCQLAEGVRLVGSGPESYLLHPGGSVVRVTGLAGLACEHLAAGQTWHAATTMLAGAAGLDLLELRVALWRDLAQLRLQEYVIEPDRPLPAAPARALLTAGDSVG